MFIAIMRTLMRPTTEAAPVQAPMTAVFTHTPVTCAPESVDVSAFPVLEVHADELNEAKAMLRTEGHWIARSTPLPGNRYALSIDLGGLHR